VVFERAPRWVSDLRGSEGEFDLVAELADGGEELVQVRRARDYVGEIGVYFHMPRSATVARTNRSHSRSAITAQAFRERAR